MVVIDTGIDIDHPFFGNDSDSDGTADRIVYNYDFYGSNDADASDTHGHGSNVAGIIGSSSASYLGVASGVDIIALKIFPDGGNTYQDADLEEALDWVVDNHAAYNVVAVNMSLGGGNYSSPPSRIYSDAIATLINSGVTVVAAAGNRFYNYASNEGLAAPAILSNVISVGAVWDGGYGSASWSSGAIDHSSSADRIVSFSQRHETQMDVLAPGAKITSANWNGATVSMSGTSQAAPHVAGLLALMQDAANTFIGRSLSVSEITTILKSTGTSVNDGDDEDDNVSNTNHNWPRIDAYAALDHIAQMGTGSNHRPVLSNPSVTPLNGDASDTYTFTMHYYDQDGDSPLYGQTQLYLSGTGTPHQMTRISGSAANGVYSTGQLSLASGTYQHLFRAVDTRGLAQSLGWLPGPYLGVADGNDFIDISRHWEDHPPNADGDGVVEAGESALLDVKLRSAAGAQDVDAVLSTTDNDIDITDWDAYYDDFAPGEWQWAHGDFNMDVNFSLSAGQTRRSDFTLTVTYELGGQQYHQSIAFAKTFYRDGDIGASFEVVGVEIDDSRSIVYRNNGDGIFQTGERVHLRPVLRNSGTWSASNINVELYYSGTAPPRVDVLPGYERYPDLSTGGSGAPEAGERYPIVSGDLTFTGSVPIGIRVDWDENTGAAVEFDNAFYLSVQPAPIIDTVEDAWSFGVVSPGEQVSHSIRVANRGTQLLTVSNMTTSAPDTTIPPEHQSFSIAPGEHHEVPVSIDTTGMSNGTSIARLITFISDGRLMDDTPPSNTTMIAGTVRSGSIWNLRDSVPERYYTIDISGTRIVWQDKRPGGGGIYVYDAATGQETNLTSSSYGEAPRVSGDIVAWTDYRSGNADIYAFDLASQQEFLVVGTTAHEELIGVDSDWIAFSKQDFTYDSYGQPQDARNVYIYEISSGDITKITNYSASPGSPLWSADGDAGHGDLTDGVLVWLAGRHAWIGGGNGWNNGFFPNVTKYAIGVDSSPINLKEGFDYGPVTSGGRVVWTENISSDEQVFLWEAGSIRQITSSDRDVGGNALAFSGDMIVYDKGGSSNPGLFYWDLLAGQEYVLTDTPESSESASMDGNGIVWLGDDPGPKVFYTFLNQPDLAILPGGVQVSDESPTEGDVIDISVVVRNLSDYDMRASVTVRIYYGDPDAGGTPVGSYDIVDGLVGQGERTVLFSITVPQNAGPGDPETHEVYARIIVDGFDDPENNTAYKWLDVWDDDTAAPVVSSVVVTEHDGDGDGIIAADEQVHISWELADPSGIGSVELLVDGTPVILDGDYYAILGPLYADGFSHLQHEFIINVTDDDNSPAAMQYRDSFDVAPTEEITVLYEGQMLQDDQKTVIDFGGSNHGATTVAKLFTIRNDGDRELRLGVISAPSQYTVTGSGVDVLQPGESTGIVLSLQTENVGTFAGSVVIANSDGPRSPDGFEESLFTFPISGTVTALPADISVWDGMAEVVDGQTTPIDIGTAEQGAAGPVKMFTIRNDGDEPLVLTTPIVDSPHFIVSDPVQTSLGAGETTTFTVTLKTDVAWSGSETISFTSSDVDENPFDFVVSGAVEADVPEIVVGTLQIRADRPNQVLRIYVAGGQMVQGLDFYVQIGDGGAVNGGTDTMPVITSVDIVGPGTLFNQSNTGQTNAFSSDLLWAVSATTNPGTADQIAAAGVLAYVTIDATGTVEGESYSLLLSGVAEGIFGAPGVDTGFAGIEAVIANGILEVVPGAEVVGRHVFYNHSAWDGNEAGANASDDNAIATDKQALLPGETATFANYTSYSRGINGIMMDIDGLAGTPTASDFSFEAGNSDDPSTWAAPPAPLSIVVRAGEGESGSDRVTIIWADNGLDGVIDPNEAVAKQWLQVTVLSDANGGSLGLAENDVFCFGNAVGETGNVATNAIVNAADEIAARNNPAFSPPATITNAYDFDRNRLVNAADQILARNNITFFDALRLITVPAAPGGAVAAGNLASVIQELGAPAGAVESPGEANPPSAPQELVTPMAEATPPPELAPIAAAGPLPASTGSIRGPIRRTGVTRATSLPTPNRRDPVALAAAAGALSGWQETDLFDLAPRAGNARLRSAARPSQSPLPLPDPIGAGHTVRLLSRYRRFVKSSADLRPVPSRTPTRFIDDDLGTDLLVDLPALSPVPAVEGM